MRLDTVLQDLKYGARSWRAHPALFATAVVALALGIGANTTIFSVVQTVLLRPLPYREADRLVDVFETAPKNGVQHYFVSPSDWFDWRDRSRTLDSFSGYWRNEVNLTDPGQDPERVPAVSITHTLLATLGIQPVLGHDMRAEDEGHRAPAAGFLTTELWHRRYGGDPAVIGKSIAVDGIPMTVIGILPPGIHFAGDAQIWNNLEPYRPRPTPRFMEAVAKLRSGVTLQRAQAEMDSIARTIAVESPETNRDWGVGIRTIPEELVGNIRPALLVLSLSAGLLLLLACANVANLLLAQAAVRWREVALRAALGASVSRLARQFFTESLLLAIAGGCAGLLIAYAGVQAVSRFGPASIPRIQDVSLNQPVLLYTLALSLATGILFGMAPVLRLGKAELIFALKESERSASGSAGEQRGRNLLVIAQVTLAVVLVSTAGLLIKSLGRLTAVNPGFRTEHVLTAKISLPRASYGRPLEVSAAFDRILASVESLPGVRAAGTTTSLPLAQDLDYRLPFSFVALPPPRSLEDQTAWHRMVSPGLFRALGSTLIAGRDFDDHDGPDAPPVVIINETLARQYWAQGSPLGQKLRTASGGFGPLGTILLKRPEIIGVVTDIKYSGLAKSAEPAIYFPSRQAPFNSVTLVVRSDASLVPDTLIASVRQKLGEIDRGLPLAHIRSMSEQVAESLAQPRLQAILLGAFSLLALLLGSVGIYGVLSYAVVRRTHEIGIRTALGGSPAVIRRMVLGQGLKLVGLGLAAGIALSFAVGRLLEGLLFQVKPADPAIYGLVCAVLAAVGTLAGYVPAWTASRIDPNVALRES